jgi:hypothetical protein
MAQDECLFAQLGDSKYHTFRVTFITQNDIGHLCDRSRFIESPINIEDRDGAHKVRGRDVILSYKICIGIAKTSGTTINQGLRGYNVLIDCGLELNANVEGGGSGLGCSSLECAWETMF